jgi:hypothetical protein
VRCYPSSRQHEAHSVQQNVKFYMLNIMNSIMNTIIINFGAFWMNGSSHESYHEKMKFSQILFFQVFLIEKLHIADI